MIVSAGRCRPELRNCTTVVTVPAGNARGGNDWQYVRGQDSNMAMAVMGNLVDHRGGTPRVQACDPERCQLLRGRRRLNLRMQVSYCDEVGTL